MLISELIKRLCQWNNSHGDLEVEVFHSGYYGSNRLVDITTPMNRRVLMLVTVPVDWENGNLDKWIDLNIEQRISCEEKERIDAIRQKEVPLDSDEDRARTT